MGYTHYWTQPRDFTTDEWGVVLLEVAAIVARVRTVEKITIVDGLGKPTSSPEFSASCIAFNGSSVDDQYHETFSITRIRETVDANGTLGRAFCKTARKPYDIAVTACLCYMATQWGYDVTSDGQGEDFLGGVAVVRSVFPQRATIDIPYSIMEADRWVNPWVNEYTENYKVRFCVDGSGYVHDIAHDIWLKFTPARELAVWLDQHKHVAAPPPPPYSWGYEPNIWNPTGSFYEDRNRRLAQLQSTALQGLFLDPPASAETNIPPPFVRPGQYPLPGEQVRKSYYYVSDMVKDIPVRHRSRPVQRGASPDNE